MITVLTPTYNRAYILSKLYASLQSQTSKDFEWVVVDDGSSDNTEQLVKGWIEENKLFKIIYKRKKNGGKHRALNYAIGMVQYEYCFIVDSDDYLTTNAIERVQDWIQAIDDDKSFAGVSGLRGYIDNGRIGGYPKSKKFRKYIDATNLQRQRFDLGGDKAEVYRTEILRKYPFPEFEGEKFLSEDVVWDAIARDGYKFRWFNEIIYRCEYLNDGLTGLGLKKFSESFEGYTFALRQRIELRGLVPNLLAVGGYVSIATKEKGLTLRRSAERLGICVPETVMAHMIWSVKNAVKAVIKFMKSNLNDSVESQ